MAIETNVTFTLTVSQRELNVDALREFHTPTTAGTFQRGAFPTAAAQLRRKTLHQPGPG